MLDVSKLEKYQDKDIDFILYYKNGSRYSLEIKTDDKTTGNMFFETISNVEFRVLGCMLKTKAKYILYYFPKYRRLYVWEREEFVKWAIQGIKEGKYEKKKLKNKRKNPNDPPSHTIGYPIPLEEIEKQSFCIAKIENFN